MDAFFTSAEANAWGGFLSAHSRLSRRLEENLRRNSGISHAEYEVLLRLFRNDDGRLRINELAAKSVLTHSGTSRLIDRLDAELHGRDRRVLTEATRVDLVDRSAGEDIGAAGLLRV